MDMPKMQDAVTGTSRICRACGGIIDEMPDASPVAETVQTGEEAQERPGAIESTGPNWKCSKCGAIVPGDFDVCWKCLATNEGSRPKMPGNLLAQVNENDQEAEAAVEDAEILETDDEELALPTECSTLRVYEDHSWIDHCGSRRRLGREIEGRHLWQPTSLDFQGSPVR